MLAGSISETGNRSMLLFSNDKRHSLLVAVAGDEPFSPSRFLLAQDSSAVAVNVSSAFIRERTLSRCFSRDGSLPWAIMDRASSRRFWASLSPFSGFCTGLGMSDRDVSKRHVFLSPSRDSSSIPPALGYRIDSSADTRKHTPTRAWLRANKGGRCRSKDC